MPVTGGGWAGVTRRSRLCAACAVCALNLQLLLRLAAAILEKHYRNSCAQCAHRAHGYLFAVAASEPSITAKVV